MTTEITDKMLKIRASILKQQSIIKILLNGNMIDGMHIDATIGYGWHHFNP